MGRSLRKDGLLQGYYVFKSHGISASAWMGLEEQTRKGIADALHETLGSPLMSQASADDPSWRLRTRGRPGKNVNPVEYEAFAQCVSAAIMHGVELACRSGTIRDALQLLPRPVRREAWQFLRLLGLRLPLHISQ